jgi:hypothetical protein
MFLTDVKVRKASKLRTIKADKNMACRRESLRLRKPLKPPVHKEDFIVEKVGF